MSIEILGLVVIALGCGGWLAGTGMTVTVFLVSTLLGAAAAIVLTSLGMANVQPAHLLLAFLLCSVATRRSTALVVGRSLAFPSEGFWLLLTAIYALVSALLLPRLFAGSTYVFAIARTEVGPGIVSMPLGPTSGNITQPVYFLGDVLCFFAFLAYGSDPSAFKATVRAVLVCTAVNLCFAVLDVGGWLLHLDLLSPVRNANYRMLDEVTAGGLKRIVGSFPEASTFAYCTLGWFAFCTRLWLAGIHSRITGPLALLSFVSLLFSTSSTGYAGTVGFLIGLYFVSLGGMLTRPVSRNTLALIALMPVAAAVCILAVRLDQPLWDAVQQMIDSTILNKMATQSGVERAMWNAQSLVNFADTHWLGAGVGSVRASSFPLAVLGNIGAIGAVTYGAFLLRLFWRGPGRWRQPYPAACQSAARWACFAELVGASVSGSFIDLGLPFFAFAGLACAGPLPVPAVQRRAPKPVEGARSAEVPVT